MFYVFQKKKKVFTLNLIMPKIFNFSPKIPPNVGGEGKNFIFSLSSHTLLSSYL